MSTAARIATVYFAALAAAVPAVLLTYGSVRFLHANYEGMPDWLDWLNLALGLVGSVVAYGAWIRLFRKASALTYVLGLPIAYWAFIRFIVERDYALGYFFNIYCCREDPPSLVAFLESFLSPVSPWVQLSSQ